MPRILAFLSILILIWSQLLMPSIIFAQEATPSALPIFTTESTPSASSAPSPSPSPTPVPVSEWQDVITDHLYQAPQNNKVSVKFNKLPENPGKLNIKEVTLTDKQVSQTGALSSIAYDISSDMENGTFEYTLTLPASKTENVEVKASEDGQTFVTLGGVTAQTDTLTITGLNHFTLFVVTTVSEFNAGVSTAIMATNAGAGNGNVISALTLDQSQTTGTTEEFFDNTKWVAQTFTVGEDDPSLKAVRLSLKRSASTDGDVTVEIWDACCGEPDPSNVLATASRPTTDLTTSQADYEFTFNPAVDVVKGDVLAIVVRRSGAGTTTADYSWFRGVAGAGNDQYPDGSRFTSTDSENAWIEQTVANPGTGDLRFETFVLPFDSSGTQTSDVLDTQSALSKFSLLSWSETLPTGTNITFEVRASNTTFAKNALAPAWVSLGTANSPISLTTALPDTYQYFQWRATLTSTSNTVTPTLHDVTVTHSPTAVFVNSSFSPGNAGGHAFGYDAFTNIQDAVNAVSSAGTVNIATGTYDQAVTIGKNLTVTGAGNTTIIKKTAGTAMTITAGTVNISQVKLSGSNAAVDVTGGNVTVSNSEISGNNTNGVTAGAGVTLITASQNYWGSATGPTHSTNSGGTGDSVSNNVQYRPYYTDEARTTLSTSTITSSNFSPATFFSSGIFSLPSGTTSQSNTPSVNINQQLTMTVAVSGGVNNVVLPQGTTISKIGGGNIDSSLLAAANVSTSSLSGFTSGTAVEGALQWGIPNLGLEFSQAITLKVFVGTAFNGQTLNVVRSTSTSSGWTSDGIAAPATCTVSAGICEFQATKASYYATTRTTSFSSSSSSSTSSIQALSPAGGGGTPPTCNDQKPGSAPTLISTVAGTNNVILNWSKALNPVTYYLATYGLTSGAQQYGNPNIGGPDTTSYTVSGLSGGTTYYFKVRAGNGCAPGDFSSELSATPGGGFVESTAAGFAPGVLGEQTAIEDVGIGKIGQVQGEVTESAQISPTSQPQEAESEPFDAKVLLIAVVALIFGFGIFKLIIR